MDGESQNTQQPSTTGQQGAQNTVPIMMTTIASPQQQFVQQPGQPQYLQHPGQQFVQPSGQIQYIQQPGQQYAIAQPTQPQLAGPSPQQPKTDLKLANEKFVKQLTLREGALMVATAHICLGLFLFTPFAAATLLGHADLSVGIPFFLLCSVTGILHVFATNKDKKTLFKVSLGLIALNCCLVFFLQLAGVGQTISSLIKLNDLPKSNGFGGFGGQNGGGSNPAAAALELPLALGIIKFLLSVPLFAFKFYYVLSAFKA